MVARRRSEQMAQRQADFGMIGNSRGRAAGGSKGFALPDRAIRYALMDFVAGTMRLLAAAAALALVGCGGSPGRREPIGGPGEKVLIRGPQRTALVDAASPTASGAAGLPGPPGAA